MHRIIKYIEQCNDRFSPFPLYDYVSKIDHFCFDGLILRTVNGSLTSDAKYCSNRSIDRFMMYLHWIVNTCGSLAGIK